MRILSCFIPFFLYLIAAEIEQINQIINGKFSNPGLPSNYLYKFYYGNIEGWTCQSICQILNCTKLQSKYPTVNQTMLECSNYVIDLNSQNRNQVVTQQLTLSYEYYWLQFDYLYPQTRAKLKQMQVTFNQEIIFYLKPNVSFSIEIYHFKMRVQGIDGTNKLVFRQLGNQSDGIGFKIANVSLNREYNNALQNTISYFFDLQFLNKGSSIPGGRIFFRNILSFMVNFDRLQFYSYHNRNYSVNVKKFLFYIRQLQSIKGNLIEGKTKQWLPWFINEVDMFFASSVNKTEYINYSISDDDQKHETFSSYIKYFLIFTIPIIIIIFILLHIVFNLIKNWSISILLRPYAFYATFIFLVLQGNIEEIAFHAFGDIRIFFSFTFQHKIVNLVSLGVLFITFFLCFGLYFWLKVAYAKKVKIITDSKDDSLSAILSMNFDKGMIIFLLGLIHQILLPTPTIQIFILIAIEIIWLAKISFTRNYFPQKLLLFVRTLQSLLRIYLQISSLVFTNCTDYRIIINDQYHSVLIFALITVICIDVVLSIYFVFKKFFTGRIFRKNSVILSLEKHNQIDLMSKYIVNNKINFQSTDKSTTINGFQFNSKVISNSSNSSQYKFVNFQIITQTQDLNKISKGTSTIKQRLKEIKGKTKKKYKGI